MWRSVMCSLWLFILKKFLCWENGVLHQHALLLESITTLYATFFFDIYVDKSNHFSALAVTSVLGYHTVHLFNSGLLILLRNWSSSVLFKAYWILDLIAILSFLMLVADPILCIWVQATNPLYSSFWFLFLRSPLCCPDAICSFLLLVHIYC